MDTQLQPRHIAMIMDGNRRWATDQGKPAFEGHMAGYHALNDIVEACVERGFEILTVYAFSTENWKRTPEEVKYLLELFSQIIREQAERLHEQNIRVKFIGDLNSFSDVLRKEMEALMEKTAGNTGMIFNIAASYGGRDEIVHAVKEILLSDVKAEEVTEDLVSSHLYTAGQIDPDYIIRTSGEERLSNFLTWQGTYSELYFTDVYWPDFTPDELDKALEEYASRQRRFGK